MSAPEAFGNIIDMVILENQAIKNFLYRINSENRLDAVRGWGTIHIPFWVIVDCILKEVAETTELQDNEEGDPKFSELKKLIFVALVESFKIREFIRMASKEILNKLLEINIDIVPKTLVDAVIGKRKLIIRREPPQKPLEKRQYIDGVPLSENEEVFEEYCAEHFDEEDWLKKHRLMLEPIRPKNEKK